MSRLPESTQIASQAPRAAAQTGRSFVLHAAAAEYEWHGAGQLSIKTFTGGRARYRLGAGCHDVDDTAYFVVNQGQPYTITIEADVAVESLCVFFAPGLAEDVERSLIADADALLADPAGAPAAPSLFFEQLYPHDSLVSPLLRDLRGVFGTNAEPGALDERLRLLMQRLLQAQRNVYRAVERLPAARPATREELYRRLVRARDYAAACLEQPLTLEDIAAVACLSPNHLLRSFRQVFGMTPHQFLTRARMQRARRLLRTTDLTVAEVAVAVGYTSVSSFTGLFGRHTGCAPAAYRRQTR